MSDQTKSMADHEKLQTEKLKEALKHWLLTPAKPDPNQQAWKAGKLKLKEPSKLAPMVFGTEGSLLYPVQQFPSTTATPYIKTTDVWDNTSWHTAGTVANQRAAIIYLVFTAQELMNLRVTLGTICYCLETCKMYQSINLIGAAGIAAGLAGNSVWKEIYVNPETRLISGIPESPQVEIELTKDQEAKYQEFESKLMLKATPGRLDQESEKQENDNEQVKIKSEPTGPPDDPDVFGTWDD